MGEKGAEVAPAPVAATQPPDDAGVAAIASIFGNIVDSAVPGSSAATPQPMGELGSELSNVLPGDVRPSIPNLTSGSTPAAPSTPGLAGLKPTASSMADDLADPLAELRP